MSIDKIKERIKMIEENNFEINEIAGRNIYTADDIKNIINATGSTDNIFKGISKTDRHLKNVNAAAKKILGGSSTVIITNGMVVTLNDEHQVKVEQIYQILHNFGILTPEINNTTWLPARAYVAKNINNLLSLYTDRNGMVRLYFNDNKQTQLTSLRFLFPKGTDSNTIKSTVTEIRKLNFINNVQIKNNQGLESIEIIMK
jgi:hypothetical protein